jgi:hypothetical protein
MNSLYKDGNDWKLNGSVYLSGQLRLAIDRGKVALLGGQTGERVDDYVDVTTISKNALDDKYASFEEFYEATELFFIKNFIDTGFVKLPGQRVGYDTVDKFGLNPLVEQGTPADIWEGGGIYNFDAFGTAPIVSMISSSPGDDLMDIDVYGLDIDGNEVVQTVTMDGQIRVALTTPLWRVFRMINVSDKDVNGTIYCYVGTGSGVPVLADRRAIIDNGNNQTLMALYTIPKGKVGYLYKGEVGVQYEGNAAALAEYANIHYRSRRVGGVFTTKKAFTLIVGGTSIHTDNRTFPDVIPAMTDIVIRAHEVSADMGIWATFDILLVDENKFPEQFLTAIGS